MSNSGYGDPWEEVDLREQIRWLYQSLDQRNTIIDNLARQVLDLADFLSPPPPDAARPLFADPPPPNLVYLEAFRQRRRGDDSPE